MDSEDGAAVARGALSSRTRLLVVIAALAVIALAITTAAAFVRLSGPSPVPIPSASSATPTPRPTGPLPLAAAATSDSFDAWTVAEAGGSTRFLETESHHHGNAALQIVRPAGDAPTSAPQIAQTVTVPQDSRISVTFWASSDGSPAEGAVQVTVGGTAPATISLPAEAFPWTRFGVVWTVPAGVTSAPITIAAAGETPGTLIDDVAVQGQGSHGVVVRNAGFESTSAPVAITDPSLILQRSSALHLSSRLAPSGNLEWSAQEYTGGSRVRGHGRFVDGAATLPLASFSIGYYTLTLRVDMGSRTVTRSTNLVVTTAVPAHATTPLLGVGVHLGALDGQLEQKLGDLAALGIRAARTDADWATIEQRRGQYDFSSLDPVVAAMQKDGMRPLLIPDYRNVLYDGGRTPSSPAGIAAYARFAAAVAARYPAADIDVYNEFDWRFNNGDCGKTPQCYLSLLNPASAAVKAANASAAVAGPDISGIGVQQDWLNGFIAGGGLGLVDALDFHPYVQPDRPDVLEDQLDTLRASMTGAGAASKPIWFTEFGDATMPGWVNERQQAEDVARVFGVAASHGVTRIYWYDAIDDGPDRVDQEDNFGLFRTPDSLAPTTYVPKPAAAVFAALARSASSAATGEEDAIGDGGKLVHLSVDASIAWSAQGVIGVTSARGLEFTSMTGRAMRAPRSLGSSPLLVRGTGRISTPE